MKYIFFFFFICWVLIISQNRIAIANSSCQELQNVNIDIEYLYVGESTWYNDTKSIIDEVFKTVPKTQKINYHTINFSFIDINNEEITSKMIKFINRLMPITFDDTYEKNKDIFDTILKKDNIDHRIKYYAFFIFLDDYSIQLFVFNNRNLKITHDNEFHIVTQNKSLLIKKLSDEIQKKLFQQLSKKFPQVKCDFELILKSESFDENKYTKIPFLSLYVELYSSKGIKDKDTKTDENGRVHLQEITRGNPNNLIILSPLKEKDYTKEEYGRIKMDESFWEVAKNGKFEYKIPKKNPTGKDNYYTRKLSINFVGIDGKKSPINSVELKNEHPLILKNDKSILGLRDSKIECSFTIPYDENDMKYLIRDNWKSSISFLSKNGFELIVPFNWALFLNDKKKEYKKKEFEKLIEALSREDTSYPLGDVGPSYQINNVKGMINNMPKAINKFDENLKCTIWENLYKKFKNVGSLDIKERLTIFNGLKDENCNYEKYKETIKNELTKYIHNGVIQGIDLSNYKNLCDKDKKKLQQK